MRKLLLCLSILISFSANSANYFGIDYKHLWMRGSGRDNLNLNNVLGSYYNGFEVYASHRFNNDVGLSLGWQQYGQIDSTYTFAQGEQFLGVAQDAGDNTLFQTKIRGISLDLNGFLNLTDCFEAIGQLGVVLMQAQMTALLNANGTQYNLDPSNTYYPIPRIGLIIQYFCTKCIGLRAVGQWEGTNLYHMHINNEDNVRQWIKPFRHGWTLGVGLVGKF